MAAQQLNEIVERSLMLVRHHVEMAGITIDFRPLAGDDTVVCDEDRIQQALVALLVNAVEAMSDGGALRLRVTAAPSAPAARPGEADGVEIEVADTGSGIPPAALPHIFEPFFTTKEDGRGLGLGLSVAYGIIEQHHGRIQVASTGEGTTFTIFLPRAHVPAANVAPQPVMNR
jgi:two-component system NtrC family sensor kinase